ncbi:hypothetical protein [Hyphomicrobium facile]|uniref:Uncharacterized protein n=1 Tax=Hyphomicrobium facile TaxID=51670 RepID=A0A1I7NI25_9HYPH|nr:hypothetical protein [Hyphomicrobium facile]SFV34310.1 hypothetical protein SAMN04488557_2284 [Hyphomicrobium facile]
MLRFLFIGTVAALAGIAPVHADTTASSKETTPAYAPNKTSDRTPDNRAPDRTPGASATGAVGTEIAKTPDGTSDRTPSNHYKPHAF